MKRIFILGCTGSIGTNTIAAIQHLNHHEKAPKYKIIGLSAHTNKDLLKKQINLLNPEMVCIDNESAYQEIKKEFPKILIRNNIQEAILESTFHLLVNAVVGSAGLEPTLLAIEKKADIALANKETLVMAGDLVIQKAKKKNIKLLPIDSEHSAIFMMLKNLEKKNLKKVILTASGGPFYKKNIKNPSVEQALKHPTWKMGKKISIDSATMMNKGLEIIEAHYLFNLPYEKIETIIHPQSIVHSFIETIEGELYAQIGHRDMKLPIQNALTYPHLYPSSLPSFKLWQAESLQFFKTDLKQFPLLKLAFESGKKGGSCNTILNAANEAAVNLFLLKKITFKEIYSIVYEAVSTYPIKNNLSLKDILALDKEIKKGIILKH